MKKIYEAHMGLKTEDFDTPAAAAEAVVAHGSGHVVTFVRGYDGKDRSSGMSVYENGAWRGVDISGGC